MAEGAISWDAVRVLWAISVTLVSLAGGVFALYVRTVIGREVSGLTSKIVADVAAHGNRLATLETAVIHSPTKQDINNLQAELTRVSVQVGGLAGEMSGMSRSLSMIHEHLLDKP